MTSDKHRETARRIMDDACLPEALVKNGTDKCLRIDIAAALAQAEREGMKRAAEIVPRQNPQEEFSAWLTKGPALAKAAGCYVGIRVTPLSEAGEG